MRNPSFGGRIGRDREGGTNNFVDMSISKGDQPGPALRVRLLQNLEGHQGAVYDLCTDGAGGLLSAGGDGWIARWNRDGDQWAAHGQAVARVNAPIFSLAHHAQGLLRAGTGEGEVIDIQTDGQWTGRSVHQGATCIVTEQGSGGADGRWISANADRTEWVFPGRVRCVLHGEAEDWVGTSEGRIHSLEGGWKVEAHEGAVRALMEWPGKQLLASVGGDGRLKIWKRTPEGLEMVLSIDAHKGSTYRLAASPCGRWVATCSRDKSVALWNAQDLSLVVRVARPAWEGHIRSVNALCWLDQDHLASAGDDGRILIWRLQEEGEASGDYI